MVEILFDPVQKFAIDMSLSGDRYNANLLKEYL